ncbi:CDGSH iron-sulfur domain-containing protein [Pseudonocardia hispaniensis]|uniref:CDGSH iron-sulfur domain-containing protein n=1 Tax=Pseudonocardia hispaniensis TaxID=904933 RepID=A0ABW1IZY9_9PSEU
MSAHRTAISQEDTMPTVIKTVNNGPLRIKGAFRVVDHDGTTYDLDGRRTASLCRCGHSSNKPFCDGTHNKVGFTTDDQKPASPEDDQN